MGAAGGRKLGPTGTRGPRVRWAGGVGAASIQERKQGGRADTGPAAPLRGFAAGTVAAP